MPIRLIYLLGFTIVALLLLASAYLQIFDGIMPCPLCSLQRFTFGLLGILFLIGLFLQNYRFGRFLMSMLISLTSVLGVFLAGRQIWLQHFPNNGNECGVSLQYMLQALPLNEVLQKIFAGSAECSQTSWQFLYFNMAEWALIWFVLFLFLGLYLFSREMKNKID